MAYPRFQPHSPTLLSSSPPSQPTSQQQQPPPTLHDLIDVKWNMIASSSSMWLDRKHSIHMQYTLQADSPEKSSAVNELTTWYAQDSNKETATRGSSSPLKNDGGYTYQWRGAGWLRMVTTRWEIVGMGALPSDWEDGADENATVVMVTFVQKTIFSPQAVSVLIRRARMDDAWEERVVNEVKASLRALGDSALDAEVEKLRAVPRS